MGEGVKGCNCPICTADRDGTGDAIGASATGVLVGFVILIVVLVVVAILFG